MGGLTLIQPMPALNQVVNYFWAFDGTDQKSEILKYRVMADGLPGLIVQQYEGQSVIADQQGIPLPTSFVYGQVTTSFTNFAQSRMTLVGVSLKPQSLPLLFRTSAAEFTNQLVTLDELTNDKVNEQLLNATSLKEKIHILSSFLLRNARLERTCNPIVADSVHRMNAGDVSLSLSSLQAEHRISERYLEQLFKAFVGVSPHQYQRITRFQKVIRRMRGFPVNKLSDVAYDLSYADQSHFIRDFKAFSGFTPKAFLQKELTHTDLEPTDSVHRAKRLVCCQ